MQPAWHQRGADCLPSSRPALLVFSTGFLRGANEGLHVCECTDRWRPWCRTCRGRTPHSSRIGSWPARWPRTLHRAAAAGSYRRPHGGHRCPRGRCPPSGGWGREWRRATCRAADRSRSSARASTAAAPPPAAASWSPPSSGCRSLGRGWTVATKTPPGSVALHQKHAKNKIKAGVPKLRGLVEICTNQKNVKARDSSMRAAREWRIASFTWCFVENVSADGRGFWAEDRPWLRWQLFDMKKTSCARFYLDFKGASERDHKVWNTILSLLRVQMQTKRETEKERMSLHCRGRLKKLLSGFYCRSEFVF